MANGNVLRTVTIAIERSEWNPVVQGDEDDDEKLTSEQAIDQRFSHSVACSTRKARNPLHRHCQPMRFANAMLESGVKASPSPVAKCERCALPSREYSWLS
jgi:hypothetical protein